MLDFGFSEVLLGIFLAFWAFTLAVTFGAFLMALEGEALVVRRGMDVKVGASR